MKQVQGSRLIIAVESTSVRADLRKAVNTITRRMRAAGVPNVTKEQGYRIRCYPRNTAAILPLLNIKTRGLFCTFERG